MNNPHHLAQCTLFLTALFCSAFSATAAPSVSATTATPISTSNTPTTATTTSPPSRLNSSLMVPGTVISGGHSFSKNSSLGHGSYADINYTQTVWSVGINTNLQNNGSHANRLFIGIGMGRWLQLQMGYGDNTNDLNTQGNIRLYRLRSDFSIGSLARGLSLTKTRSNTLREWHNRLYFSFYSERHDIRALRTLDTQGLGIGWRL